MNTPLQSRVQTALIVASLVAGSTFLRAAEPAAAATDDQAVLMEAMPVTGSYVSTGLDAVHAMVPTLDSNTIDGSMVKSNLLDVLRKTMPQFSGGSNLGNTNANTNSNATKGGSALSLRNLDTLVLLNGRRVTTNAAAGFSGAGNFIDVNLIPTDAIDRIEIVTDGSSALYGSDAVAGVVNIILRKNYQGGKVGGHYGFSTADGNYDDRSAYAFAGFGNDHINITAGYDYSASEPIFQNQRPFSSPILGKTSVASGLIASGSSGLILNPSLSSPRDRNPVGTAATAVNLNDLIANGTYTLTSAPASYLDISPYVTELLKQERNAGYVTFDADIFGKKLQVYAELLRSQTKDMAQLTAQGISVTVAPGAPYNPTQSQIGGVGFRSLARPRGLFNTSTLTDLTFGFKGEISDHWNWEVYYKNSADRLSSVATNVIFAQNSRAVFTGGYDQNGNKVAGGAYSLVQGGFSITGPAVIQPAIDPFARSGTQNPASLANLFGDAHSEFWSRMNVWNGLIRGSVVDLPAGPLSVAVGGEYRNNHVVGSPDANSRTSGPTAGQWLGNVEFDPFDGSNHVSAGFGEIKVPITSPKWHAPGAYALQASVAFRAEDYSGTGHAHVPKYVVEWQPFDDQVTVRFSNSKSFTAPALFMTKGAVIQGQTGAGAVQGVFPSLAVTSTVANLRFGANPNLRPSTSISHSYSIVIQPKYIKRLRLEVDYTSIKQRDYIGSIGTQAILASVEQLGAASPYANKVGLFNYPGLPGAVAITQPGQLSKQLITDGGLASAAQNIYVVDQPVNISGIDVRAVDVSASYEVPTESIGTFTLTTSGTFFLDYKFQALPTEPYFEYAGEATVGGSGSEGTLPGYRFYTVLEWRKNQWGAMLANSYIPSVSDIGPGGLTFVQNPAFFSRNQVDAYSSWDVAFNYTVRFKSSSAWMRMMSGTRFMVGINNFTNEMPPLAKQSFVEANADISTYSPIGRLFYVSAELKF